MRLDYFIGLPDDDDFVGYTKRFMAEFARRAEIGANNIGVQLIELSQEPRVWAVNYLIGKTAQMAFHCQVTTNDMYELFQLSVVPRCQIATLGDVFTDDEKLHYLRCCSLMTIYEKLLHERGFFLTESETAVAACLPYDPPIAVNLVSTLPEITYNCSRT